jgi:alkylhydroperoxidase family enzyme
VSTEEYELRLERPKNVLDDGVMKNLREGLACCPDLAFAHLVEAQVRGQQEKPELVLFAWLVSEAVGSVRSALNLISEAVARALPEDRFVDVVILNSAPELLRDVEGVGCLLVERDPEERQAALQAAESGATEFEGSPTSRWWWPF